MGLNCLKATVSLPEDSLLFTTKSPGIPGPHLIEFGRMTYNNPVVLTLGPWIGNPAP